MAVKGNLAFDCNLLISVHTLHLKQTRASAESLQKYRKILLEYTAENVSLKNFSQHTCGNWTREKETRHEISARARVTCYIYFLREL